MSLYDEISLFWGIVIFIACISIYVLGYVIYRLGYRDGESDMLKKIERRANRQIRRGNIKRLQ